MEEDKFHRPWNVAAFSRPKGSSGEGGGKGALRGGKSVVERRNKCVSKNPIKSRVGVKGGGDNGEVMGSKGAHSFTSAMGSRNDSTMLVWCWMYGGKGGD